MRLRHIEVFHAVYTTGSVSNAARLLNVAQPSVSKVLRHAEDQLGYDLFERARGKLIPTEEARLLFEEVSVVYSNVSRLRRYAENLKDAQSGHLRVAAIPTIGENIIPKAIAHFRTSHPKVAVDIETLHFDQVQNALAENEVDVGFVFQQVERPGFRQELLGDGEFVCIGPTEIMSNRGDDRVSFEDLGGCEFIRLHPRGPLGRLLSQQQEASQADLITISTVETYSIARSMVKLGLGVSIVDEITAGHDGDEAAYMVKGLKPPLRFSVLMVSNDKHPLTTLARSFSRSVRAAVAESTNCTLS